MHMVNTGSDGIHEVFDGDVQYPFADVGAPNLLHISSVTQENRRLYKYTCPYCRKELRPRLGTKKAHCFAHKPNESCELDRYIHSTAERLLKEKWDSDQPFEITMTVRSECERKEHCFFQSAQEGVCSTEKIETFDLKRWYNQCLVEKKVGGFIPDLCLIDETGKHDPIFIEIWSKHQNSLKKQTSEYKIIEIRLKTIQDLEELPKHPITESESVTFSHFKISKKTPGEFEGVELMKYRLYSETLKSHVFSEGIHCTNYERHHKKAALEIVSYRNGLAPAFFQRYCTAIALARGYDIRICYDCKFYGDDYRTRGENDIDWRNDPDRAIGCRRYLDEKGLVACNPEDAKSCDSFRLKEIKYSLFRHWFSDIKLLIWSRSADGNESEEQIKRNPFD